MNETKLATAKKLSGAVVRRELAGCLAWAAYMTHNLLDGIDLQLSNEEKKRLSKQAQKYEKIGVKYLRP